MNASISPLVTRSSLMQAFNLAKNCGKFEAGRLNRALGIAQRNTTRVLSDGRLDTTGADWHMTTLKQCDCKDYQQHKAGHWCKHRIAYVLLYRAAQLNQQVKE